MVPLIDGGADIVENCASICPNCHRMLHFGKDREAKSKSLQTKISQLET
ncbi:HNH endonuclease [Vibrio harveyi]